jgi:hypothetical protein
MAPIAILPSAVLFVTLLHVNAPAVLDDDAVKKAAANFQQAAYEFALHLGLEDPATANRQMQETMRYLSVLRTRACPSKLRSAVNDVSHNLERTDTLGKRLDAVETELKALSNSMDVTEARRHLAEARDAVKSKDLGKVQAECLVVVDAVVGQVVNIPLVNWVEGIKKARMLLGTPSTKQRMAEALDVLRGLEGVDRFRGKAVHDSLTLAEELLASAIDTFDEDAYPQASEQLRRCEIPLKIAGRASGDEKVSSQLTELWQRLVRADEMIVSDMDLSRKVRTEGFKMLDDAKSTLRKMADSYADVPQR